MYKNSTLKTRKTIIMNYKYLASFILLFTSMFNMCIAQDANNDGYNDNDIAELLKIKEYNTDNSLNWTGENYSEWNNITWSDGTPKTVVELTLWNGVGFEKLKIANLNNLKELYLTNNGLTEFSIEGCENLEYFHCTNNSIDEINLSGLKNLNRISIYKNKGKKINASECSGLTDLDCTSGEFESINLTGCFKIQKIDISDNRNIASLDLQNLPDLSFVNCSYNKISSLSIDKCDNLISLDCGYNNLTTLSFNNIPNLISLDCSKNNITELNISSLKKLGNLICHSNNISNIDLSASANILNLVCSFNKLSTLDLSFCKKIKHIDCSKNTISDLNLKDLQKLEAVNCSKNQINSVELLGCLNIKRLDISYNEISQFKFSEIPMHTKIYCYGNRMPFSVLQNGMNTETVKYYPQRYIYTNLPKTLAVGETIDYSSEEEIKGKKSVFKWFKDGFEIENSSSKLITSEAGTYNCVITNENFPEMTLRTTSIVVSQE